MDSKGDRARHFAIVPWLLFPVFFNISSQLLIRDPRFVTRRASSLMVGA